MSILLSNLLKSIAKNPHRHIDINGINLSDVNTIIDVVKSNQKTVTTRESETKSVTTHKASDSVTTHKSETKSVMTHKPIEFETKSVTTRESETKSVSTHRPIESETKSVSTYRPIESEIKSVSTHTPTNSPKALEVASKAPKALEVASKAPKAPEVASKAPKAPEVASKASKAPEVASKASKAPEATTETRKIIDPIVIGLELYDPLYADSPFITKIKIEKEYAEYLESCIDSYYNSECGRRRGWTKVYLTSMIVPRCASGGNIHALQKAKAVFNWSELETDKRLSGFLDFVCVVKGIRVGVITPDNTVIIYPAADKISDSESPIYPLYFIKNGTIINNYKINNSVNIIPPPSVINGLNVLSIEELESVASKLGMTSLTGKKEDKVKAIAVFKLKQRLA